VDLNKGLTVHAPTKLVPKLARAGLAFAQAFAEANSASRGL